MLVGDIVLALPLRKSHHRDLALGGEPQDRSDKLLADRVRQTRRRETRPPVASEKRRDPARVAQLAHIPVAVHPIDALQLEHHVLAQHIRGRQRYAHHQLRSWGPRPLRGTYRTARLMTGTASRPERPATGAYTPGASQRGPLTSRRPPHRSHGPPANTPRRAGAKPR